MMKVIQITNRDQFWEAGYKQYYFGVHIGIAPNTFVFKMDGFTGYQYVNIPVEVTEIT